MDKIPAVCLAQSLSSQCYVELCKGPMSSPFRAHKYFLIQELAFDLEGDEETMD